jgi:tellurite methyltransferase
MTMTDYEKLYAEQGDVCGDPFPDFVRFFDELLPDRSVLDLGCGQGRDALVAARRGHRVVGVDLSATGVRQMVQEAEREGLSVVGIVADIVSFEPDDSFDVVVLDRVLHMLPDDDARGRVLARMVRHVQPGGHLLVADTSQNLSMIRAFMDGEGQTWSSILARKGFLFWRRQSDPSPRSTA